MAKVKRFRKYDARGRRQQAAQRRDAIVAIAEREFSTGGYARTTVAAIARQAGVSVETIYKMFGGKPGLVRAVVSRGLAGAGAIPAEQRSDAISSGESDPRRIVASWAAFVAEIGPRVSPLLTLLRAAAASDPELEAVLGAIDEERLARMRHNARKLARRGFLRAGVTAAAAADILWTCTSPQLYQLLVEGRGWSSARFGELVGTILNASLLDPM
jgi:AcrR family transcriptional regulator